MGEGMFQHLINENKLSESYSVDSAGTSAYHIGASPDERMTMTAIEHGVELTSKGRQVTANDIKEFDIIIAMDKSNYGNLIELAEKHNLNTSHIKLMREFDDMPEDGNVPDPYYGGMNGFEEVYRIIKRSCENLLHELENSSN